MTVTTCEYVILSKTSNVTKREKKKNIYSTEYQIYN